MASLFWVGATNTWNPTAGTKWATSSGGVGGAAAPTAADDVFFDALSTGPITLATGAVCRSVNFTGFTGTLTHPVSVTLPIGDATAGAGNIALKMVAGMTYTPASGTTSLINFISTSATTQDVICHPGSIMGALTFNGAGASWQLGGPMTQSASGTMTLTTGSFSTNNQNCTWGLVVATSASTKTLDLGTSTINTSATGTTTWNVNATGTTLTATSSTINCLAGQIAFAGGTGLAYGTVNFTGSNGVTVSSASSFINLNRTGTASKTDTFVLTAAPTVTGNFTVAGNSAINRVFVSSGTIGTSRTITNTGATQIWSNADFMDIALTSAYNASAITGGAGDAGGNTNITFTTPATQTWSGTSGGLWSTNAWTTRVPLPQDDVIISSPFSAVQTVTPDMPRLGRSINWTGSTGNPTWAIGNIAFSMYGSLTLVAGMICSGNTGKTHIFGGRGTYTITTAGVDWRENLNINAPTGTYTLQDSLTMNGSSAWTFTVTMGTFATNNFAMAVGFFVSNGTGTRGVTLGTSVISLQGTTAVTVWSFGTITALTFSGASSTITIANTSANTRTFAGGGLTYGTFNYVVAGSTGTLVVTGSNTFNTFNFSDASNARILQFTAATTNSFTTWNVFGIAGFLISVQSVTAAVHTLSKASGTVSSDYLSITNSTATGGATWYAGANSTNVSGNTGWIFTAPPSAGGATSGMLSLLGVG